MSDISKKSKKSQPRKAMIESKPDLTTCAVCLEDLPTTAFVVCLCDTKVCRACSKEYILNSTLTAHCMQCKVAWGNKFISDNFTQKWLDSNDKNGYRSHRKKCALEREKSMIPETLLELPKITARKEKLEILQGLRDKSTEIRTEIKALEARIRTEIPANCDLTTEDVALLRQELRTLEYDRNKHYCDKNKQAKYDTKIVKVKAQIKRATLSVSDVKVIRQRIKFLKTELKELHETMVEISHTDNDAVIGEKVPKLLCPCPQDYCKGMIQSSDYRCVVCQRGVCNRCREPKPIDGTHKCNKDALENVKLLRTDTKPCPKCAVSIFKIEGCFDPNTPTLLYDGSIILASDVKVGTELLGDDGLKRTVEEVFSGEDDMFIIKQDQGFEYTVSQFHTLALRFPHMCSTVEITVSDYLSLSIPIQQSFRGYKIQNPSVGKIYVPVLSKITVEPVGKGPYIGWRINGNHRFVAPDFTVLRNCDQMFCTSCKTPFSWKTGAIITGTIHNPHALQWQRENGGLARDIQDVPCGGLPQLYNVLVWEKYYFKKQFAKIEQVHRIIAEIDEKLGNCTQQGFSDLRVLYVTNQKTEKEWESAIFKRERANERKQILADIYTTFRTISVERFRDLQEVTRNHSAWYKGIKAKNEPILYNFLEDMEKIRVFINKAFEDELSLVGSAKPIQILETWEWSTSRSQNTLTNPFMRGSSESVSSESEYESPKRKFKMMYFGNATHNFTSYSESESSNS